MFKQSYWWLAGRVNRTEEHVQCEKLIGFAQGLFPLC